VWSDEYCVGDVIAIHGRGLAKRLEESIKVPSRYLTRKLARPSKAERGAQPGVGVQQTF
jgi:hypothetical protein